jgi:aminoglycoside 3-N-acetyltransferase I
MSAAATRARARRASPLIQALKPLAKARGAWVITVQAGLVDAPAVSFYTRLGTREDVLHFDIAIK